MPTQRSRGLRVLLLCGVLFGMPTVALAADKNAIPVSVTRTADGFELRRAGQPYKIDGVGGRARLEELKAYGGNSIRTWHWHDLDDLLDRAHKLDLTVAVGLWLGHERHGFDYNDAKAVAKQHAEALAVIRKHRNHPAVLMWGIGNEMEGDGDNEKVWKAVNDLARDIKQLDPHHPTMTVVAGVGQDRIRKFVKHCPHIDVLGVNVYGDLSWVPPELERQGLDRPYVITEFGPTGWWQVQKTSWGAEFEPSSSDKAATYLRGWETAIRDQPRRCFGSYAFLWGHKQEHTQTWFGMFLPTGERTASVDVMSRAWTGKWPGNRCPELIRLTVVPAGGQESVAGKERVYTPGTQLQCEVLGRDPDGDELKTRWELRPESTDKRTGGDPESVPPILEGAVVEASGSSARVLLPDKPGAYRLFVFLQDAHGGAATANVPFMVKE